MKASLLVEKLEFYTNYPINNMKSVVFSNYIN